MEAPPRIASVYPKVHVAALAALVALAALAVSYARTPHPLRAEQARSPAPPPNRGAGALPAGESSETIVARLVNQPTDDVCLITRLPTACTDP